MTLEKAIEWLPEKNQPGRIDKFLHMDCCQKFYLTKSGYGMEGSRRQEDLDNAALYAGKVIEERWTKIYCPIYSDIFRLKNNFQ
jgi:hypothetical protein